MTCHRLIALCLAALVATQVHASPSVSLGSAVYIEKSTGTNARSLEPAKRFSPGDRVVTVVSWNRRGGQGGFVVTNPVPRALAFEDCARDDVEVSADGGRTWGRLGALRYGARLATPEDITHLRWRISAVRAMQGSGYIAYSGIVR